MKHPWAAIVTAVVVSVAAPAAAQSLGDVAKQVMRPATVNQQDASDGLRAALDLSARSVADRLGRPDGFFGDPKIRIPLPGTLARLQRNLKPVGLAAPFDALQLSMNRAAEAAMPVARDLFLDAIRAITFQDALGILRGGETAATDFLRRRTQARLVGLLTPPMEQALGQTGAFRALDGLVTRTGAARFANVSRRDMTDFAVHKTLDGAFGYIAEEERGIRKDPTKRTTDLLRRVFGGR
jgi:hypothetical protein